MKKFEYTVGVPAKGFWWGGRIDFKALSTKLNELGAQGWETVTSGSTNMWRVHKRCIHNT
jgi:hypothetical protein